MQPREEQVDQTNKLQNHPPWLSWEQILETISPPKIPHEEQETVMDNLIHIAHFTWSHWQLFRHLAVSFREKHACGEDVAAFGSWYCKREPLFALLYILLSKSESKSALITLWEPPRERHSDNKVCKQLSSRKAILLNFDIITAHWTFEVKCQSCSYHR